MISTRTHGIVDYASSVSLLVAPRLLRFPTGARRAARGKALGTLALSALTDYELGLVRRVPMRAHLGADALGGVLLAASPWLFGYRTRDPRSWLPHVVAGLGDCAFALISARQPASGSRTAAAPQPTAPEPGAPPSTPQHTVTESPTAGAGEAGAGPLAAGATRSAG